MSNPTSRKLHAVTEIATAVVEPFRFINFAGAHAGPGEAVQGVSENAAAVGGAVSVVTGYSALVLAAVAIAAGDSVGPAADGTGRVDLGSSFVALDDAAAGELVEVRLAVAGVASAPGSALILKAFTGRSQLTGGTAATKTPLMEIPIPDGWLSRLDVRMDIEASFNWTNNANTKEWGIAIGASSATGGTVAASVDLRTLSNTATASMTDKIVVQRSAETPTRLYLAVPNNARTFGTNAGAGSTVGAFASASIDPTATGRSLWVWGRIANTADQVSLEHLFVQLQRGVS